MNEPGPQTRAEANPMRSRVSFGRISQDATFTTHDGPALYYRHWPVMAGDRQGCIVLFHRNGEHSARLSHVVDELNLAGFVFFAWDARGHGRSPGPRGYSPSFAASVMDVQAFFEHLRTVHAVAPQDVFVVAQGDAAVPVLAWVLERSPALRGMTLAAPALQLQRAPLFLRLRQTLRGPFGVNIHTRANLLTQDPQRIASYEKDRLITPTIVSHLLLGSAAAAGQVMAQAAAITVPTQVLVGGDDRVVRARPQHELFERLGSAVKERHELDGLRHDVLGERDRYRALAPLRAFIDRLFARA